LQAGWSLLRLTEERLNDFNIGNMPFRKKYVKDRILNEMQRKYEVGPSYHF
jgi:hypothetical protein